MALKSIEFENFRGWKKKTIQLDPHLNFIRGMNGIGKTSLREGICFVFCGTDSVGTKNPQHLINSEEAGAKVTAITDKAEISRTLSRKGNGTIKLVRAGVPTTLTQSQLEEMLGPIDLFLSTFVPGYFLALSPQKQTEVINSVIPQFDRAVLLKEISGIEMTEEEASRYKLHRRPDIVANAVAQDRRAAEHELSRLKGQKDTLTSIKPMEKPEEPRELSRLKILDSLKSEWDHYEAQHDKWSQASLKAQRVSSENKEKKKRKAQLEKQLSEFITLDVPKPLDFSSRLDELEEARPEPPTRPSSMSLPDTDLCPTCGQTVGLKHREKVCALNAKAEEKYKAEKAEYDEVVEKIDEEISGIRQKIREHDKKVQDIIAQNSEMERKVNSIKFEISKLEPEEIPDVIQEPSAPEERFSQEEYDKCFQVVESYKRAVNQYEYVQQELASAEKRIADIDEKSKSLLSACERYNQLEKALKQLPQEEMKRQMAALEMGDVKITVDNGVHITFHDVPYQILSSGNAMKANTKICLKLNELSQRPLNMVFLDNFDLVDEMDISKPIQFFAAQVVAGQDELEILHKKV